MTYKGWNIYAHVDVRGSATAYLDQRGEIESYDYDYETDMGDIYEYYASSADGDAELWDYQSLDEIKKEIRLICREREKEQ